MTLEMSDRERRVIGFIVKFGQKGRWVSVVSRDVVRDISCIMYWSERSIYRAIADLKVRKWVFMGVNDRNQPYISLTKRYFADCELEGDLMRARRALVSKNFGEMPNREELVEILALSETMGKVQFNDSIRAAVRAYRTRPPARKKRTSNTWAKPVLTVIRDKAVSDL